MAAETFPGGLWEHDEWELLRGYVCDMGDMTPCAHAVLVAGETYKIPWVVKQWNEGGYATTGVCAECVVEAMRRVRGGE